jgi:hypothetical protein
MRALMSWLNQNSGAVTAIVTAIYAFFTVLLWRATHRQATLTQRAFEASNRPYISLRSQEEDPPHDLDAVSFTVLIENLGSVPAHVTKWEVSASLMGQDGKSESVDQAEGHKVLETLLGACLFPSQQHPVSITFHKQGILRTPLPLRLMVTLEYRGVSERSYRTSVEVQRTPLEQRQRATAT